jgi:hypothetical protein
MRRTAPSALAVPGALCLAFLLAACGAPASAPGTGSPDASPTATVTETSSATPSPTTTATATDTPAEGWTTYTTKDGELMFDLPATWTIKDPAGDVPAGGGVFVEVRNPDGKSMATLRTNMVVGSECTEKQPYSSLDSEPVPALAQSGQTPRFVFEGRMDPSQSDPMKANILAYGITSGLEPTGPEACPIFHFFTWPPSGAMFGGVYDPFAAIPGAGPEVDNPQAYMGTQEYKDIKKMITSLRPAS